MWHFLSTLFRIIRRFFSCLFLLRLLFRLFRLPPGGLLLLPGEDLELQRPKSDQQGQIPPVIAEAHPRRRQQYDGQQQEQEKKQTGKKSADDPEKKQTEKRAPEKPKPKKKAEKKPRAKINREQILYSLETLPPILGRPSAGTASPSPW